MSKHFNVVIGVPSGQFWLAQFGVDLVNLMTQFTRRPLAGYKSLECRLVNVRSSILSKNRLDIVKTARKLKATHILYLDTDHTFPPYLVHALAQHGKPVVAANCVTKQIPANTTARQRSTDPRGQAVYSDPDTMGLEQVWRVGTGVMLVEVSIFDKIGLGVWDMKYLDHAEDYQGEDWTFCEACEKAGIPIYVDHEISRQIGHVGNYEYTHDVVGTIA